MQKGQQGRDGSRELGEGGGAGVVPLLRRFYTIY